MIKIRRIFFSILKETIGFFFLMLGGVHLLKYCLKGKAFLIVLNYHNFSKYNNYKINRGDILKTGYSSNFDKQIRFLKKHFDFSYPEDYFESGGNKRTNILLTFDDGYRDNYDIAFPILKKHDAKAIFFIVTSIIGTKTWLKHDSLRFLVQSGVKNEIEIETQLKKMNLGHSISNWLHENEHLFKIPEHRLMMNWEEVNEIANNDFKIGSHTHQHSILSFLDYEKKKMEIQTSIEFIKNNLNIASKYFAYPNGLYNRDSINILKQSNVEYSFTTKTGFNLKTTTRHLLKRIGVNPSDSIGVLLLKLYLKGK